MILFVGVSLVYFDKIHHNFSVYDHDFVLIESLRLINLKFFDLCESSVMSEYII